MVQGKIKVQYRQQKVAILKNADEPIYLYVPSIDRYSTIGEEAIIAYAAKAANIAQNDMRATFEALADAFEFFLTNGHSFKVDGVGTFSLSVRAKQAKATEADAIMGADAVEKVGINFLPAREIKQLIESASIETAVVDKRVAPELTDLIIRKLVCGSTVLISNGVDTASSCPITGETEAKLYGFNLPSAGSIQCVGMKAFGEEMREWYALFTYKTDKNGVAVGRFDEELAYLTKFGEIELTQPETSGVSTVLVDGLPAVNGNFIPAGTSRVTLLGSTLASMPVLFNGVAVTRTINSDTKVEFLANFNQEENLLQCGDFSLTFNCDAEINSFVSSLSANGVTVYRRGQSPIIKGRNYQFVVLGRNIKDEAIRCDFANVKVLSREKDRIVFSLYFAPDAAEGSAGTDLYVGSAFGVTLNFAIDTPLVLNVNDAIPEGGEIEVRNNSELPYYVNFAAAIPEAQHGKVKVNVGGVEVPVQQWKTDNKSCMFVYSAGLNTRNAVRVTFDDATIFNFTIKGDRNVD